MSLKIYITDVSYKDLKKCSQDEKISFLDVNKMVIDNFSNPDDLSDMQRWILNQMIIKKIDTFVGSNTQKLYVYIKNPSKETAKALSELIVENEITSVTVDIH